MTEDEKISKAPQKRTRKKKESVPEAATAKPISEEAVKPHPVVTEPVTHHRRPKKE